MCRWGEWICLTGSSELHLNSPQGLNICSIRVFDQIGVPEIPITLCPHLYIYIQSGREISAILLTVVGDGWKDQKIYIAYNMGSKLDNRTHYTISQSTVWYDIQLTNDSLTTLIVFRSRNYSDIFLSYVHLFSYIPSNDNLFSICAGFASDRIGRVYVNSTNMAGMIFFHKILTFRTII